MCCSRYPVFVRNCTSLFVVAGADVVAVVVVCVRCVCAFAVVHVLLVLARLCACMFVVVRC